MNCRVLAVIVSGALLASACGGTSNSGAATTSAEVVPPTTEAPASSTSSEATSGETTSTTASSTPESTPTSDPAPTSAPSATPAPAVTAAPPTTAAPTAAPAGLPASWFGVYLDPAADLAYAVEIDTASGDIVRTFEDYPIGGCIELDDDGECMIFAEGVAPVAVDVSSSQVAFGLCCEPVSGWTQIYDRAGGNLVTGTFGSEPAFADFGNIVAVTAYFDGGHYILFDSVSGETATLGVSPDFGDSMDWDEDRLAVETGNGVAMWVWDGSLDAEGTVTPTVAPGDAALEWASPTFQSSGNVVVAQHALAGETDSLGLVLDTSGGFSLGVDSLVLASFAYGGHVVQQTYDASGVFLIYTLADGSVRWQGAGQVGTLVEPGSNFWAAAW